jgi:hypothetical protein
MPYPDQRISGRHSFVLSVCVRRMALRSLHPDSAVERWIDRCLCTGVIVTTF